MPWTILNRQQADRGLSLSSTGREFRILGCFAKNDKKLFQGTPLQSVSLIHAAHILHGYKPWHPAGFAAVKLKLVVVQRSQRTASVAMLDLQGRHEPAGSAPASCSTLKVQQWQTNWIRKTQLSHLAMHWWQAISSYTAATSNRLKRHETRKDMIAFFDSKSATFLLIGEQLLMRNTGHINNHW